MVFSTRTFPTSRVHGDQVSDFLLKLVKVKFSYVKKTTKPNKPLFRNARENHDNAWEKIFVYEYTLFSNR